MKEIQNKGRMIVERKGSIYLFVFFILALTFVVSGCTYLTGSTLGENIDDSTITTEVKAKYTVDSSLSSLTIGVKTYLGQVTLTGSVRTKEQEKLAVDIAQRVKGVKGVTSHITVRDY